MLTKTSLPSEISSWFYFEDISNSKGVKKVLELPKVPSSKEAIQILENHLGEAGSIIISMALPYSAWGDLVFDTPDWPEESLPPQDSSYWQGMPQEAKLFLNNLSDSGIDWRYTGCLLCQEMDQFLVPVLAGIQNREIVYSPRFISRGGDRVLFFHHTGDVIIWEKDWENA